MDEQSNPKCLETANEVIDYLGGTNAVTNLLGLDNPRIVSNWRERGLPPETFLALSSALNAAGAYAPPSLWRMREPVSGGAG